jgi:Cys-tRNA(Pro) deacylase
MSSLPPEVERVAAVLRAEAVEARIEEFPEGTHTARDAADALGCELSQIVKTVVLVADGAFVLVLVPGDRRADEAAVAEALPAELVRTARPEEVEHATGFPPGGVAPFPQRAITQTLFDVALLRHEIVWIGAGTPSYVAGLAPADLQRLTRGRGVDLQPHG